MILAIMLICFPPQIKNTSGLPMTRYDMWALNQATRRWGELYNDAPCVKLFWKLADKSHRVICGDKKTLDK